MVLFECLFKCLIIRCYRLYMTLLLTVSSRICLLNICICDLMVLYGKGLGFTVLDYATWGFSPQYILKVMLSYLIT